MQSPSGTLNKADIEKWFYNFLQYVAFPTVIAFLGSYVVNYDVKIAWGVALVTLFNSLQNLANIRRAGPSVVNTPV